MMESEWLTSTDPIAMLHFLMGKVSDRKLRRFACRCCRHPVVWDLLQRRSAEELVEVAERYVEGDATWDQVIHAAQIAPQGTLSGGTRRGHRPQPRHLRTASQAQRAALSLADANAFHAAWGTITIAANLLESSPCDLMREMCGPLPFWLIEIDPTWRTPLVMQLTHQIEMMHDYGLMPILCDALQDAGCMDAELIAHCQAQTVHVRGCWVMQLLLGRE